MALGLNRRAAPLPPAQSTSLGAGVRRHSQHYYTVIFEVNIQVLAKYNNCKINTIRRFNIVYANVRLFLVTLIIVQ